jgi:hypothetical protein
MDRERVLGSKITLEWPACVGAPLAGRGGLRSIGGLRRLAVNVDCYEFSTTAGRRLFPLDAGPQFQREGWKAQSSAGASQAGEP